MSGREAYLVAGSRPWSRRVFDEELSGRSGRWSFVSEREELTRERVAELDPRYIFFLHWSWIVPAELLQRYECVGFHMTDLPYGRGGSPLQNLIARGVRETKLTAFRMTDELDAGPVYLRERLSLEGGGEEIFLRANRLAAAMIERLIDERPTPQPQSGESVAFRRRRPEESEIGGQPSLDELFDHIRMLDAEGYPRAFLDHAGFRFRFRRAALYDGRIEASVTIEPREES